MRPAYFIARTSVLAVVLVCVFGFAYRWVIPPLDDDGGVAAGVLIWAIAVLIAAADTIRASRRKSHE